MQVTNYKDCFNPMIGSYLEILTSGILKLELSWRRVDGYLYKKLDLAQILVAKSNVTMTIADSTMATALPSLLTTEGDADVKQGRSNGADPLEQRNVYLHIDVFRMDQVIRNVITNAVFLT